MTDLQMWSLLVGFLAPPVIAVVQQPRWGTQLRVVVTTVLCVLFGGLTAYFEGSLDDGSELAGTILLVLLAAMTFYKRFWTPTKIAPRIEAATSPRAHVTEEHPLETTAVED